jgi:hypothetical protein
VRRRGEQYDVTTVCMQLFGMGFATCTQRVIAAALGNDVEFDLRLVNLSKDER